MPNIIAEAGLCANSIEWAHEAVDAAAEAGCTHFKVQLLTADRLTAPGAPRYDRLHGPADQHAAFTGTLPYAAWAEVYDHARETGIIPFASCWDEAAVEASEQHLNPSWYKVGSADITHHRLLRVIAQTGKGVILSTGAATSDEITDAIGVLWDAAVKPLNLVLMACTLSYPCEPEDARLSRIGWLAKGFFADGYGYSDHTTLVNTGGLAVAAGASWLEKHFTVTPGRGGDHDFALNPADMERYVWLANTAWGMLRHADGDEPYLESEKAARYLARRSLHAISEIAAGDMLVYGENVGFLRPGTGAWQPDEDIPLRAERTYRTGDPIA